ncbi:DUF3426 domain-containing protein [Stenotrophomonas sp. PD6]|uniref:DUF3426 domain-containing protein n=1 Tax=Stenotrophomonas sp. PD6 TaxID=3368612 RepID=UPI003BA32A57
MTEPTPPPRRPLATFLRASTEDTPAVEATRTLPEPDAAVRPDDAGTELQDTGREPEAALEDAHSAEAEAVADAAPLGGVDTHDGIDDASAPAEPDHDAATPADEPGASPAPSFLRLPGARLPTPRWQWGLVAGLVVLLSLQIAVADRARLAADAGSRPWIAGLCGVLRCSLPAWQEPTAFNMISRDVRPVPGQPGALQVQASFRNDARWAQAWPSLRLSLSDPDGRVIGTSVFAPRDYLDPAADAAALLEPGQSAQIAFRVREPAASTVAFTFEFL